jgi:DNA-binding response OmpR family regulator
LYQTLSELCHAKRVGSVTYTWEMPHGDFRRPVVFVIAGDWALRTAVRADLRERGVEALGLENAEDAGGAIASGEIPAVIVVEATAGVGDSAAIQKLAQSIPSIVIASRTETLALPATAAVFYRPVRIGEIVARVQELLQRGHAA